MSERKSINKYIPADFDPSKITKKRHKVKSGSGSLPTVRMMTPFSLKCAHCGEYISKSRKFNAKKEATDKKYIGIAILRFHISCPSCAGAITLRTDPKSADYVIEQGAKKNYESAKDREAQIKEETVEETLKRLETQEQDEREAELKDDHKRTTVEELEQKLNDIHRQQDLNDELEEIRERNAKLEELRRQKPGSLNEIAEEIEAKEDERLALEAFSKAKLPSVLPKQVVSTEGVKKPSSIITKKRKVSKLGIKIKK